MSKPLSVFLMYAVLLAGCSPLVAPTPVLTRTPIPTVGPTLTPISTLTSTPTPIYPDLAISKQESCRPGFLLLCRVSIDANGNVVYETGVAGQMEKRTATITPRQIEELVAAINEADVWAIEDQAFAYCTDCAPLVIFVALHGRTRTVTRFDAALGCGSSIAGTIPSSCAALRELGDEINLITESVLCDGPGCPTPTSVLSVAGVTVTVFVDANGDGVPQPSEGMNGIPVQLQLPDGKILSATTQQGMAMFDMSGHMAGIRIIASLPNLYRSYQFYLPQSGTVPVLFSFGEPTLPGKSP